MFVVVTGGPFSGKTTLVEALGRRGFATVPEAGLAVIADLNARYGVDGQKRWRAEHRAEFQQRVLDRQVALEREARHAAGARAVFLDRSRVDGLAYCRHFGIDPPDALVRSVGEARYDHVVLLDTLSDVVVRADTGRTSDRATSLALRDRLLEVYRELGYEVVVVPECVVEERVALVLRACGLAS